jgi:hypothetical protein
MGRRGLVLVVVTAALTTACSGGDDSPRPDAGPTTTIDPTADVNIPTEACPLVADADVERLLGAPLAGPGTERGDRALGCTWSATGTGGRPVTIAVALDFGETGPAELEEAAQAPGATALDGIGDEAVLWPGDQAVMSYRFVARRGDYFVTIDGRGVAGDEAALRATVNTLFDTLGA